MRMLLRRIHRESKDPKMQVEALRLLADAYFTHQGCLYTDKDVAKLDPKLVQKAFERRLEAFAALADVSRSTGASCSQTMNSMFEMLEKLCECGASEDRYRAALAAIEKIAARPENEDLNEVLAQQTSNFASLVVRSQRTSPALKAEAMDFLRRQTKSSNRWVWLHAERQLIFRGDEESDESAHEDFNAKLDELFGNPTTPGEYQCLTEQKTSLAMRLLLLGRPEEALEVLNSFDPKDQKFQMWFDATYCHYGYHLGQCYEKLGRQQEALRPI